MYIYAGLYMEGQIRGGGVWSGGGGVSRDADMHGYLL